MKNSIHLLLLVVLVGSSTQLKAQEIFEKTFRGCATEEFLLEKDSAYMSVKGDEIREILKNSVTEPEWNSLSGDLYLQIIVNPWGKSCLISMRNETNLKTSKFKLKELIDEKLEWSYPGKSVAPILHITFTGHGVQITRLGTAGGLDALAVIRKSKIE